MRLRSRSYERFSSYLLLRKLEADVLSDCWRAAPIEGLKLGAPMALRRFAARDDETWRTAIEELNAVTPFIAASSIMRGQRAGTFEGTPFLGHPWEGGRPLSVLAERAFSSQGPLMPFPVDLALAIGEKIAHSLMNTHSIRRQKANLIHGAVLPQFVWVTEDGDVRVAGQGLGRAVAAAAFSTTSPELRSYFAPELLGGGAPSAASDIFSAAAILFHLLTGHRLPELQEKGRAKTIGTARLAANGEALPADVARILERCLAPDPAQRGEAAELHADFSRLVHSGSYAATTFNLAYFVQTLLRSELEAERKERESEAQINIASTLPEDRSNLPAAPPQPAALTAPSGTERRFSGRYATVAALVLILAGGSAAAGWFMGWFGNRADAQPALQAREAAAPPSATATAAEAVTSVPLPTPEAAPTTVDMTAAREAAFEEEVNRRLREEMAKLQREFDAEQQRRAPDAQPGPARPTPAPDAAPATPQPVAEVVPAPTEAPSQTPPPTPEPVAERVREGQLINLSEVDQAPTLVRSTQPVYPPVAAKQKIEGSVIVTALISETGRVLDARVLRGDPRKIGFDEAAVAAVKKWQFTPGVKDGQRIRAWVPVNVTFGVQK